MKHPAYAALATLTLFTASVPLLAQETPSDTLLTVGHYLDFERVSDPQISPDGTRVVYTRAYVDKMNDRFESAIWMMDADGSRHRFLVDGSSPRWSGDGTRIAYLADGEPEGRSSSCAGWTPKARSARSRTSPRRRRTSSGHRTGGTCTSSASFPEHRPGRLIFPRLLLEPSGHPHRESSIACTIDSTGSAFCRTGGTTSSACRPTVALPCNSPGVTFMSAPLSWRASVERATTSRPTVARSSSMGSWKTLISLTWSRTSGLSTSSPAPSAN